MLAECVVSKRVKDYLLSDSTVVGKGGGKGCLLSECLLSERLLDD